MVVDVERVSNDELRVPNPENNHMHNVVKNNITEAIDQQKARYGREGFYNSSLSSFQVTQLIKMEPEAEKLLQSASESLNLSARSYFKTIKVAQTVADLDKSPIVKAKHLAEALNYRKR